MKKQEKWKLVKENQKKMSKAELAQEHADMEMELLKKFCREEDLSLCTPREGMEAEWAEAYARWNLAMRILDIVAELEA